MTIPIGSFDPTSYSLEDRLALIDRIWDSIETEDGLLPLTEAQRTELERRIAEQARTGDPGNTWEEVRERVERES